MKKIFILSVLFINILSAADPLYFCTAADSKFFPHLLNLIGSIHRVNYDDLGEIAVFDLGLTQEQLGVLGAIEKVTVNEVERVHPDIIKQFVGSANGLKSVIGWYAWKPVAINQALDRMPYVLWVDAGSTVLKPLNHLFKHIEEHGYFLCTCGMPNTPYRPIGWGATQYVKDFFNLNDSKNRWILEQDSAMGGVIGVSAACKDLFIEPLYTLARDMRLFVDDGTATDGFGFGRHDQTLVSVIACLKNLKIFTQDETQVKPIELIAGNNTYPLYITWNPNYVCDKTDIYSSSRDLRNSQYFYNCIRYKKGFIAEKDVMRLDEFATIAYSSKQTVYNSYILAQECIKNNIPGDFVECGVASGAQVIAMAYASQKFDAQKTIHMFDSFEGIPLAGPNDDHQPGIGAITHDTHVDPEKLLVSSGVTAYPVEVVTENMRVAGLATENVRAHKGWFEHTLPQVIEEIPKISLLRLDGDLYSSTKVCLEYLYPKLSNGGYVIIDDYALVGCKKAVDEYIQAHNLNPNIIAVKGGNGPVYWQIDDKCRVS